MQSTILATVFRQDGWLDQVFVLLECSQSGGPDLSLAAETVPVPFSDYFSVYYKVLLHMYESDCQ